MIPTSIVEGPAVMIDAYGRHLHYLRVSLTDACDLRCVYCMPEDVAFRPPAALLQNDEILTLVRVAASLGVDKVRLTGGEPTLRRGVVELVRAIRSTPGIKRLAMTTNGVRLAQLARPLAEAGLDQANISVDTLDPVRFRQITRRGSLEDVWQGIEAAEAAGLQPIKLNCVVARDFNAEDVVDLARLTLTHPWDIRFIELMPLGRVSDFQQIRVVPSAETRGRIEAVFGPLTPVPGDNRHDPAQLYRLAGAIGQLGFISSVTEPFCEGCTRLRLTADGKLRLCLLRDDEVDLMTPLRSGADFAALRRIMAHAAYHKPWGHQLSNGEVPPFGEVPEGGDFAGGGSQSSETQIAYSREMNQIGG